MALKSDFLIKGVDFCQMRSKVYVAYRDLVFQDNVLKKANKANNKDSDKFKDIINELIKYNELTIEIIGSWLWISGNTYPLRDMIKNLGLLWSKGRKSFNG